MATLQAPMKRETVRTQVSLRDAISDGTFRSGEKLIERDLCERLSISRPSLREALRTLEAEKPSPTSLTTVRWCGPCPCRRRWRYMH